MPRQRSMLDGILSYQQTPTCAAAAPALMISEPPFDGMHIWLEDRRQHARLQDALCHLKETTSS